MVEFFQKTVSPMSHQVHVGLFYLRYLKIQVYKSSPQSIPELTNEIIRIGGKNHSAIQNFNRVMDAKVKKN